MRRIVILLLIVHALNAEKVDVSKYKKQVNEKFNSEFKRQARNGTMPEIRVVGGTDIPGKTYKWAISIYDDALNYLGIGGVVNSYWCATYSPIIDGIDPTTLFAYEALDDTSVIPAKAIQHVGKISITYPGATSNRDSLALLKVCPPWRARAQLPTAKKPSDATYSSGTQAKFFNYGTKLNQAEKPVGETCECELVTGYDPTVDFCLQWNTDFYNLDGSDVGSLAVIGGKFAGINLQGSDATGEVYLDMAKYVSWIKMNAIIL